MSMTVAYIIFAVVMLHLVLGFVWVFYKISKKKKEDPITNSNSAGEQSGRKKNIESGVKQIEN